MPPRSRNVRSAWDDEPLSRAECLDFYNRVATERRLTEEQLQLWLARHQGRPAPTVEAFIAKLKERGRELLAMMKNFE